MIEEREQRAACSLPFSNSIVVASEKIILEARGSEEVVLYCTEGAVQGKKDARAQTSPKLLGLYCKNKTKKRT